MAELAAGAVSSLLGVIRNEMALLDGVRGDVQFIKEEMESMGGFLLHLDRTAPPGGEHDEQVRAWMNQVRVLARDCNNCLDLYLYRGNPDIHRARGGLRRYLWWAPWFLRKLAAQRRAAVQLHLLKDRARDVGERRRRYGVKVPETSSSPLGHQSAPSSSSAQPAATAAVGGGDVIGDDEEDGGDVIGDDEEDGGGGDQLVAVATATEHYFGPRAFFQPRTLDEYVKAKLMEWVHEIPNRAGVTHSIAIVAPDAGQEALALAYETLGRPGIYYRRRVLVDIPAVHHDFLPLRPKEVLYYILRELQHPGFSIRWQGLIIFNWDRQVKIHIEMKMVLSKIKEKIQEMKVYEKLDKIKEDIRVRPLKRDQLHELLQKDFDEQENGVDRLDLHVVFQLLLWSAAAASQQDQLMKTKDKHKLAAWYDVIITKLAKKLKEHMEAKAMEVKEHMEAKAMEVKEHMEANDKESDGGEDAARRRRRRDAAAAAGGGGGGGDAADAGGGGAGGGKEDDKDEDERPFGLEARRGTLLPLLPFLRPRRAARHAGNRTVPENDDERKQKAPICLTESQYEHILQDVFPKTMSCKPLQAQQQDVVTKQSTKTTTTTLIEDQIKKMIQEAKQEILQELQERKSDRNQATLKQGVPGPEPEAAVEVMEQKIEKIKDEIKEQLKIKGLLDKIKHELKKDCPLFILKVDEKMDESTWEDTRNALSLLKCRADALVFTNTKDIQRAREFCYPRREPIDYSPVGLYHDTVLELTSRQRNEDYYYDPQIFWDILEECKPHEFCMKIFAHAIYANPKRSNEELRKLRTTLQAVSLAKSLGLIAKKMFKFSYNDLPKEYKSCLLYLAIFPHGYKIRRSSLIGRWVAEGLIFHDDWDNSVHWANKCFDELINRWLVYPADVGATGKVKSCIVGALIHGFITKIARKQHIMETRLSHHLARHFSIFNNLRLRSSDGIDKFFQILSETSRVSLLKVLDLEGCQCFGEKKQRYLKVICNKMLLLKYLGLKGTDVTQLPTEINNLRELEVLDIRETNVPESATVNLLLLKLKRLLAGHTYLSPSSSNTGTIIGHDGLSSVQVPEKIEKMINMEVLSNVKARNMQDLKDIGRLCQLRKLGVVINDKESHLRNFLQTISNLHETLRSLSITIPKASQESTSNEELQANTRSPLGLRHLPKLLESLSISGTTQKGHLLPLFARDGSNRLAKVTLSSIYLNQDNLKILAKLPKLQCVRLRHIVCAEGMLTFKKNEFKYLKYLLIECCYLTVIIFENGAACELEKMVLSSTNIRSIDGVDGLQKLEELELNNNNNYRLLSSFDNAKQIAKLTLRGTLLGQAELLGLAKKPKMRCLVLLEKSCAVSQITFNEDDFPKLNLLTVNCSSITKIIFTSGSAPKLEKIIWSSPTSLSGIGKLPRLKQLEFNGDIVPKEVEETLTKLSKKVQLKHNKLENQDESNGDAMEDAAAAAAAAARFSFCWKNQV